MKIARVFPRKTNASPEDELSFFGPPGLFPIEIDEIHISITFSWDLKLSELLYNSWKEIAPIKIGGPATGERGEGFTPGKYIKNGYVITSRGCPNKCWFCSVWKREGGIRELEIKDGWNILDDNLLACSENHIKNVFDMLLRQNKRPEFTGGLEASKLKPWIVDLLIKVSPRQIFFAYDLEEKYEPLVKAGKMLKEAGFTFNQLRSFVLIGYPKDTIYKAEERLLKTVKAGFLPMAMLYRNEKGIKSKEWGQFQRSWARPASIKYLIKQKENHIPTGLFNI